MGDIFLIVNNKVLEMEYKGFIKKKILQRCPNCKIMVQKIDGCNSMVCM